MTIIGLIQNVLIVYTSDMICLHSDHGEILKYLQYHCKFLSFKSFNEGK